MHEKQLKTESTEPTTRTGAEQVHWNLTDLYPSPTQLIEDLTRADSAAQDFARAYRGKVAELQATDLAKALEAYSSLQETLGRAGAYAYLDWSTHTHDSAKGALLQRFSETSSQIVQKILFFEIEWAQVPDDRAKKLLDNPELKHYKHYLEVQRLLRPHLLSEPEEKILAEKSVTGASAWVRLFDEILGAARFTLRGEEYSEQEVLSRLYEADRNLRREAALAFSEGLDRRSRELTFVFNTILADKASDDRLRRFPHWLASRNLANEIPEETVNSLIGAVTGRYSLSVRFYALKRKLLGLEKMFDYDRYAPLEGSDRFYSWQEARRIVLDTYQSFHPDMGMIGRKFFEQSWIDAAITPGKRSGAYSHAVVPSAHPYIMINFTGKARDVQTLAHELGHGIHQYLSRAQGVLQASTPLVTAETASVFGEMLVFQRLLEQERDPANRLAMLVAKIDDSMATVFRQVAMNRFEDRIHNTRRSEGELSLDRFSEIWMTTQQEMFGDSVILGEHYRSWWSYIPHFIHTPGYVYAYAFGELLVLALYALYRKAGEEFSARYVELLQAGGSDWPDQLVGKLGVDLKNTGFWNQGLDAIESLVSEAESLAEEVRVD